MQPAMAALILLLNHAPVADEVATDDHTTAAAPEALAPQTVVPTHVVVVKEQAVSARLPDPPVEDQGPRHPR